MSENTVTRTVVVTDPIGVHVRTASAIQAIARRSQSKVSVISEYHRANAADIFDLLALAAPCGSKVTLEVSGPDAEQVIESLEPVFTGDEKVLAAILKPDNIAKEQ